MKKNFRIYVPGHEGMVGSAVVRRLRELGYPDIIYYTREQLDLLRQENVEKVFNNNNIDCVIVSAAKVGGIEANSRHQADFLYENLQIQNNIIWNSLQFGVKKLLFLGSSCVYPRDSKQPMKEEYLLEGPFEPTNEGYAIAKTAGIKLCEKIYEQYGNCFISCIPTNLYGENDNFDKESSHVIPSLIRKFHEAKIARKNEVTVWGTGRTRREFLYIDDLANAICFLMKNYAGKSSVNIGYGSDISIYDLAHIIKEIVQYDGEIVLNESKPDGMPLKLLDSSKILEMGWKPSIDLISGLKKTYDYFLSNIVKQDAGSTG